MKKLKVNSIISSFMGEQNMRGIGAPCTILRLQGCSQRCFGCDTPDALTRHFGEEMTVGEIKEKLDEIGNKIVLITGGEPLEQDISELVLLDDYEFILETNGMQPLNKIEPLMCGGFVMDYKLPSSGIKMDWKLFEENINYLTIGDFLKFVIRFWDDYYEMKDVLKRIKFNEKTHHFNIAAGVHSESKISLKDLADRIKSDKLQIYLNPQLHKICFED